MGRLMGQLLSLRDLAEELDVELDGVKIPKSAASIMMALRNKLEQIADTEEEEQS